MIDTPRVYHLEKLPRSLSWEMVNALLLSIDRTSAKGIRDYTMLFLVATYGIRACEVVSLTLDDIDWRTGVIQIPQSKTGNQLILPLTDAAGDVLIEYLKRSRPQLPYRELFLRIRAPSGPLKPTAVTEVFQQRVRESGLDIPYQGPHCLRHSYAVHLLRQGTPVKAISDLLGHRSTESTCVYLRLAIEDLRSVALPVPQGPSVQMSSNIVNSRLRTRDRSKVTNPKTKSRSPLRSFLAEDIRDYLQLKRSLGRNYENEGGTLHSLDAFVVSQYPLSKDLTAEIFNDWCITLHYLSKTVRRKRMRDVRNFCLYRCRTRPQSFVPDAFTFPANHQPVTPHIFSESDIARLLNATQYLSPCRRCPLRPQTLRMAIILLYTTGLRRGELLRLKLGDFNSADKTLLIRVTKFHKSRIIPLSFSVAADLEAYLTLRHKNRLPMEETSPLAWNGYGGPEGKCYTGTGFASNWRALCSSLNIFTREGKSPRIHDLRHSFAINVLRRWYHTGQDVQTKLPLLSTYMGHVSIHSTHYYITFVEGIRSEASGRFHQNFGKVITTGISKPDQGGV
jgi:integrase